VKGLENCLGVYSDESHNNRSSSESRNLAQERDPIDFSTSEQWCQDLNSVSQSDLSYFLKMSKEIVFVSQNVLHSIGQRCSFCTDTPTSSSGRLLQPRAMPRFVLAKAKVDETYDLARHT
jgi:hypothetical protein